MAVDGPAYSSPAFWRNYLVKAKESRKLVFAILLLPLLCTAFLRLSVPGHSSWRFQLSLRPGSNNLVTRGSSGTNERDYVRILMQRLVRGKARRELNRNGVTCFWVTNHPMCVTTSAVRIVTGRPVLYFSDRKSLPYDEDFEVRPYPAKPNDTSWKWTTPLKIVVSTSDVPECDETHAVPAVMFSNGGYAGNFFHSISDVLIPLFLTAGHFRSQVQLVVNDYRSDWFSKFGKFISHLSAYDVVVASVKSGPPVEKRVHCFPGAVIGNIFHDILLCNSSSIPGGITTLDFKRFLHDSFSLKAVRVAPAEKPMLLLLARRKCRAMLNEDQVAALAEEMGFRVELAPPWRMKNTTEFAELVNSCSVMMGVHGAGMTNMAFMATDAVLVQVVPLGLGWLSRAYYGRGPTQRFGLKYVEYMQKAEESTLYYKYPKDHPVVADPGSIHNQGYAITRQHYLLGQNVTINLSALRETLQQAMDLLPR